MIRLYYSRQNRRDFFYVSVMFLMFLTSLNFVSRYYYWIFLAFAVFVVTPKRQARMNLSTMFLLMFAISILLFDSASRNSVTNVIKPFVFVAAYTIGFGLPNEYDDYPKNVQRIKNIIYVLTFGFFIHYVLNLVINFGALERNTIDIWTNTVLSATSQASLASMCVGIVAALLFSKASRKHKVIAVALVAIIVLYNLILAGRTLLFMTVLLFALAFLYESIYYKKNIIKGLLLVVMVVVLLLVVYNLNLFHIKSTFESSNFYWRFFESKQNGLIQDSRLDYKMSYLGKMLEYPFGGGYIHEMCGFYAHDLYLDSYDQYGIFALIAIGSYMISSIMRLFRCLRSPAISFQIKQLVFCIYLAINIQFWIEPIMQGMPWLLVSYCLIDGAIAHFLTTTSNVEINNAR